MKKIITILFLSFTLVSCVKDSMIETHEVTLISVDYRNKNVIMYDNDLQKEVIVPYSEKIFHMRLFELYNLKAKPTYLLIYNNGKYFNW